MSYTYEKKNRVSSISKSSIVNSNVWYINIWTLNSPLYMFWKIKDNDIFNLQTIAFLDYHPYEEDLIGIQNKWEKWAIMDENFVLQTPFIYEHIRKRDGAAFVKTDFSEYNQKIERDYTHKHWSKVFLIDLNDKIWSLKSIISPSKFVARTSKIKIIQTKKVLSWEIDKSTIINSELLWKKMMWFLNDINWLNLEKMTIWELYNRREEIFESNHYFKIIIEKTKALIDTKSL